jgi:hypothetical protein
MSSTDDVHIGNACVCDHVADEAHNREVKSMLAQDFDTRYIDALTLVSLHIALRTRPLNCLATRGTFEV